MQKAYIVTASITDDRTLRLDEPLPVSGGKVRVTVEVLAMPSKPSYDAVMTAIREGQKQRGFIPASRAELDAYLKAERASWDD
jgi:hypothetical protein